ncbi:MAG: MBL fold metallo-hydrolase [Candidatus Aenigmatarchaeota archaeon]|nr:MAG: MBL fold metallo-hydrolase [Candidatus Aenigmarchaeota archaeon]
MKLSNDIFLLDGAEPDSNVFLIDGELLIDTGSGLYMQETLDQMAEYGLNPKAIKLIVITHAHFGHCGAIKEWKKLTGAKVAVHQGDLDALEKGEGVFYDEDTVDYAGVRPDVVLKDGETVKTRNHAFTVVHAPGHSPGSICLWEPKQRVLVSGDLLFLDGVGDQIPTADASALAASLKKVKKLGDIEILLPGHGAPAHKRNPYAKDAIKKALAQIK